MLHRYGKWFFLVLIGVGLTVAGCGGLVGPGATTPPAGLEDQMNEARGLFQQATDMGAKDCAPVEYAEAQVSLDLADHEWKERDWGDVAKYTDIAKKKSMEAIEKCKPKEVAPPKPTPPPEKPKAEARPTFTFPPVYFDVRKADIRSDAIVILDRIGTTLQENPWLKLEVAGHTDSQGSEEANMEISLKRAKSVATYLIDHFNISPHRLKVFGYGESRPVADNSTVEGRRMNRRVEFRAIQE